MSNVKTGDVARIVNAGPLLGCIVTVGEPYVDEHTREPEWLFAPRLFLPNGGEQLTLFDRVLRRIDNPRDDATDEMVRIAGNPNADVIETRNPLNGEPVYRFIGDGYEVLTRSTENHEGEKR